MNPPKASRSGGERSLTVASRSWKGLCRIRDSLFIAKKHQRNWYRLSERWLGWGLILEPLHGLGRSGQSRLASPSSWTQPKQDLILHLLGLVNGRVHLYVTGPRTESPAWSMGKSFPLKEALDCSGHHHVDMGGAQLSAFQAQGTICASVQGP